MSPHILLKPRDERGSHASKHRYGWDFYPQLNVCVQRAETVLQRRSRCCISYDAAPVVSAGSSSRTRNLCRPTELAAGVARTATDMMCFRWACTRRMLALNVSMQIRSTVRVSVQQYPEAVDECVRKRAHGSSLAADASGTPERSRTSAGLTSSCMLDEVRRYGQAAKRQTPLAFRQVKWAQGGHSGQFSGCGARRCDERWWDASADEFRGGAGRGEQRVLLCHRAKKRVPACVLLLSWKRLGWKGVGDLHKLRMRLRHACRRRQD